MKGKRVFVLSSWREHGYKIQGPKLRNVSSGAWVADCSPAPRLAPFSYWAQAFWADAKPFFSSRTIHSQCNYFCDVCSPSPYLQTRKWSFKGEGKVSQRHSLEGRREQKQLSTSEQRRESRARNCDHGGQKGSDRGKDEKGTDSTLEKLLRKMKKNCPHWAR